MSRSSSGNSTPKHVSPSGSKSILSGHIAKAGEKVWVAVRLRPLLPAELAANEQEAWRVEHQNTLVPLDASRLTSGMASTYSRVFGTDVASQTVYEQAGKRLVLSSMEGYNSTIFAYGPTGSGKTFTMQAILQQSAQEIFDHIKQHSTREYIIRVSALEIYNEHVRDLLGDDPSLPLKVMDDPDRGTVADGLTEEGVESVDHLRQLLQRVEERRQTRATESNDKSSRSHEIVRFYIESRPARKQDDTPDDQASSAPGTPSAAPVTISTINLVDLAGSERLPATTSDTPEQEKLRQKETGNINKSLLTLGSCIRALAEAKRFVPYRDSKLTRILQPSLSGNSKMAIVCTISPAAGAVETSKTALHFATTAKRVQMKPVVNEVKNDKTVIARMQLEIYELRAQLAGQDYQHLNAQLKAKDDQIRMTAEEMAEAQRKIDSLQRQILCGTRLRVDSKRDLAGKQAAEPTNHSMAAVRASYHVGSMVPSRQVHSDLASAMAALNADKLLLDDYLAGGSRRRARIAAAAAGPGSLAGAAAAAGGAVQTIAEDAAEGTADQQAIQQLQDPATQRTEEAVAALRNQVRCIQLVQGQTEPTAPAGRVTLQALKQQLSTLQASTTSSTDSSQLQTIHAVQIEIARMEEAEQTHSDASKALASLCKKLGMPDELVPAPRTGSSGRDSSEGHQPGRRPRHSSDGAQHASAASAAGSKDSKDTWSSVPAPGSRCQTPAGVGPGSAADLVRTSSQSDVSPYRPSPASGSALGAAAESWPNPQRGSGTPPVMSALKSPSASTSQLPRPSAATRQGSKEDRLQHDQARPSSRQSVDKELTAMLSAFQNFSEQKERLETQKMVLVNQVLKLEYALEQQDEGRKQLQQQLAAAQQQAAALQQQLAEAQHEAEAARMQAAAGSAGGSGPLTHSVSNFSMAAESEESWITGASVEVLLPKIVALWEELYVPLVYRSRFYLGFHNQDAFYYEVEYRRLLWKRNAMFPRDATGRPQRTREVNRAARTLDWERKSIAQQIKWDMTEQEREDLFSSWRVDALSKERKLQLVQKLWSRDSLAQPDGMQRSSELVVQLCGMDASEHMMELVFGKFQREQEVGLKPSSNKVGFMMNNLMRKVAPPRRRSTGPSALSRPSASLMSSFTSRVNSGLQSLIGRREDSFASMSSFTTARSNAPMSRPGTAGTAK